METSWRRLFEFVHDLLATPDVETAVPALVHQLEGLVPADCGVALFRVEDKLPVCIASPAYAAPRVREFNNYFNRRCPVRPPPPDQIMGPIQWIHYRDTEYHTDFNRPLRIAHSLGFRFEDPLENDDLVVVFNRSGGASSTFTAEDAQAIRLCMECYQRIRMLQCEAAGICRDWVSRPEIEGGRRPLSRREAEIAVLLQRRMSMREIAEALGISPRTVERHVLHIYDKLDVSTRREFLALSKGCS
jgi:DNA-binding CsgD family transcriptional regulator